MTAYRPNRIVAFFIAAILIAASTAYAAEPAVNVAVKVDKREMTVGDLVILTVSVKYPKGVDVKIPPLGEKLGEFFIRDISLPPPIPEKDGFIQEAKYTITTYIVGDVVVPPIEVGYTFKDDAGKVVEKKIQTDPLTVPVKRIAPKEAQDIKEIKAPVDVPLNWKPYALWGGSALAAIILIGAAIYYFKKYRPAAELKERLAPPLPPHETALRELDRIESLKLVEAGEMDKYYDLVTDALRNYLGARYNFNAIDLTTDEIIAALDGRSRRLELKDSVSTMLRESDMVKFARELSESTRAKKLMDNTRRVIRETTPTTIQSTEIRQ